MDQVLILSCMFSVILLLIRIMLTGNLAFRFLPWNLFLAWLPYAITRYLEKEFVQVRLRRKLILFFILWILFIPNSFYILTDLFHLQPREESSRWFDLTLILSFAWNGLVLGILSVRQMERIVMNYFHFSNSFFFLLPVMGLNALGIYIGRYMRFNSWDVVTNPFSLATEMGNMIIHPIAHFETWSMIGCFAIFMTLLYVTARQLGKSDRVSNCKVG